MNDEKVLPVKSDLRLIYWATLFISVVVLTASVLGLVKPDSVYPTEELVQAFLANDVVNIVVGLPVLFISLWLYRRGKLVGLLFWPGALFYMAYNYLIYLIAMPVNGIYLLFPLIVIFSLVIMLQLLRELDKEVIAEKLRDKVSEKFGSAVLIGFGLIFIIRVLVIIADVVNNQLAVPLTEIGLHIADVLFSVVLLICGVQLWRKQVLGYITGLGLLFQASMLFVALIVLMLIQPFLTGERVSWVDVIVVFIMGFVTFIPFGFFVRGVNAVDT